MRCHTCDVIDSTGTMLCPYCATISSPCVRVQNSLIVVAARFPEITEIPLLLLRNRGNFFRKPVDSGEKMWLVAGLYCEN